MIQNIYPLFERGRIMKKELMLAVRNYSFEYVTIRYQDFSDGILFGCHLKVLPEEIEIGMGAIKFDGFIYLLSKPELLEYTPTGHFKAVKIRFQEAQRDADSINHTGELLLDDNLELAENEIEICRFKLQTGSRLRDDYKSFADIETEFDTLNLAGATHSAIGGTTLSPVITGWFAKEALEYRLENPWDISFCAQCLNEGMAVRRSLLHSYLTARLGLDKQDMDNRKLFENLDRVLREIQGGKKIGTDEKRRFRHQIIVE